MINVLRDTSDEVIEMVKEEYKWFSLPDELLKELEEEK